MLIFNQLTELLAWQSIVPVAICFFTIAFILISLKQKPTIKILVISLIHGIALALISILIGRGAYAGTQYFERYGWPLQFLFQTRNYEAGSQPLSPVAFDLTLSLPRLAADICVYSLFILTCVIGVTWRSKLKKPQLIVLISGLVLSLASIIGFAIYNNVQEKELALPQVNGQSQTSSKIPETWTLTMGDYYVTITRMTPAQDNHFWNTPIKKITIKSSSDISNLYKNKNWDKTLYYDISDPRVIELDMGGYKVLSLISSSQLAQKSSFSKQATNKKAGTTTKTKCQEFVNSSIPSTWRAIKCTDTYYLLDKPTEIKDAGYVINCYVPTGAPDQFFAFEQGTRPVDSEIDLCETLTEIGIKEITAK